MLLGTITGNLIDVNNFKLDDVNIYDIAHSLSMQCRYNGHILNFYSVAEHSVYCAQEAEERGHSYKECLSVLLHDASEAYLSDVPRPIKHLFNDYILIEKKIEQKIFEKHGLTFPYEPYIKDIDDYILKQEMRFFGVATNDGRDPDFNFMCLNPVDAKDLFLSAYKKYTECIDMRFKMRHK